MFILPNDRLPTHTYNRSYLEEKGVVDSKQQTTRGQLLEYMRDKYASVADPIWEAWGNSYMVCIYHCENLICTYVAPILA